MALEAEDSTLLRRLPPGYGRKQKVEAVEKPHVPDAGRAAVEEKQSDQSEVSVDKQVGVPEVEPRLRVVAAERRVSTA